VNTRTDRAAARQIRTLFNLGVIRDLTDGQLLERFSTGRAETAELAFAALLERHAVMVERVCRALLTDPDDTQDAFQATFVILVKKARTLWVRDSLGPWLYQVAFRTASCARLAACRRRKHERRKAELAATEERHEDQTSSERERVLHEEIDRLPERYRIPIVLCDLQGHTCEEAARRMGCPVGTVKSWRSRGRERLRGRLTRLGLAPSAGLGAVLAADGARAAMPMLKAEETVRCAVRVLSQRTTVEEVSTSVRLLVNGVLKTMLLSKLRTTAATVCVLAFLAVGVAAVAQVGAQASRHIGDEAQFDRPQPAFAGASKRESSAPREPSDVWSLTLREAIRIGLGNAAGVRVMRPDLKGAPDARYMITPADAGADVQSFKANVMATVRSIEQQYWSLAQQHVELSSTENAAGLAEKVLNRALLELEAGRGNAAEVADARQRLEEFRLRLVTKTSDVITTERQLRNLLSLPPADNRMIVPVTAPTEVFVEPDWEASKAVMLEKHPEVLRAKAAVKRAEVARDGVAEVEQQKAALEQIVHQLTHSLARFFLEIEANYKQFKNASLLRAAAAQRLEAQETSYEEGRITMDRYLDALTQYTSASAQESQFKTSYNVSIIALEEAKGTLLEYDNIAVVFDSTTPATAPLSTREIGPKPTPIEVPARADTIVSRARSVEKDKDPSANLSGRTFSFQVTVGSGSKPVEIRGSFTITPVRSLEIPKAP
jgi:RNA polymerase sigma factor (sigma-70 family)